MSWIRNTGTNSRFGKVQIILGSLDWVPVPAGAGAEVPSEAGEAERRKFHQRLVALRCTSSPIPLTDGICPE
jgi:hypothetical protein